jgi:hypothetical protein
MILIVPELKGRLTLPSDARVGLPGEACSLANRQHVLDAFTWLEDLEVALTSPHGRDALECDLRRGRVVPTHLAHIRWNAAETAIY